MKTHIDWDESYPVYFVTPDTWGVELDLTPEELHRFTQADKEWTAVQRLIADKLGPNHLARWTEAEIDDD